MEFEYSSLDISNAKIQASSDFVAAYNTLLLIEKYARNHDKSTLLNETVEALLTIVWTYKSTQDIVDIFHLIITRRAQHKSAIILAVEQCVGYVSTLYSKKDFIGYETLCKSICNDTEGKVFVDIQRARLVRDYALYLEENNRLEEATTLMQSMHIETFTSLDRKERIDFLLIQLRIALLCKDYLRALLLSNKVNRTTIQENGFETLRLEFCRLMILFYTNENNFIENCRMSLLAFETLIKLDNTLKIEINNNKYLSLNKFCVDELISLKVATFYLICSDFIPEKKDLMNRIKSIRLLETIPLYYNIINLFLTDEIIDSKQIGNIYQNLYELECLNHINIPTNEIIQKLQLQINQHNIRVIAKYYHNITIQRFSQLLSVDEKELEKQICVLVNTKQIYAKINRPIGIISFIKTKELKEVLDIWDNNIQQLLTIVNDTCFLIETEKMIHFTNENNNN